MEWAKFEDQSLVQGTPEWHKARAKRIGGSDIPVIMRLSPYKTRRELWEEKTGRVEPTDISKFKHVRRGINAEPVARMMLEKIYGVKYFTPTLIHPQINHFSASLDGLCALHCLEIKTMGLEKHMAAGDIDLPIEDRIPEHYMPQCQWNSWIADKPIVFASYRPEEDLPEDERLFHFYVPPWPKEKIDKMIREAAQFYEWVITDTEPPDDFVLDLG